jgi:hypothetical protein
MRCPGCGTGFTGGVGTRCPRCGFLPASVGVTPMETVVHVGTGTHRVVGGRLKQVPMVVRALYLAGVLAWGLPLSMLAYYHANHVTASSTGWRIFGLVLAILLAMLLHSMLWAGAFFYGRLVTSDQIAQEAERATTG